MSPCAVLHVDTGRAWRGGQAQVFGLVQGLAARGHRQALAAPDGAPLAARVAALGLPVVPFAPRSDLDVVAAAGLVAPVRTFRPEVVHLHDGRAQAAAWPAARLAGAAVVVTRRVHFPGAGGRPRRSLKLRLPVDRWIAISAAVRDGLVAAGVPGERVVVVPSAVDAPGFAGEVARARAGGASARLRDELGVPAGVPLAGMLAAFTAEKDQATLVEAVRRLAAGGRDLHLVLVGDGPGAAPVASAVLDAGPALAGRVHVTAAVEPVAVLYGALDTFVLASHAEGLGSSVLLALAAGVPALGTAAGGLVEALDGGRAGRLVPPRDPAALAAALADALYDAPEETRALAARGLRHVAAFDWPRVLPAVEAVYAAARARCSARGGRP